MVLWNKPCKELEVNRRLKEAKVQQTLQDSSSEELISQAEIEALKRHYGFDKPVFIRYVIWLKNLFVLDLGDSYIYKKPVLTVIMSRFHVSLTFGLVSFVLSYMICIPLGIIKAVSHNSRFDHVSSILVFAGYTTPGFVLGVMLQVFLSGGNFLDLFPLGGIVSDYHDDLNWFGKAFDYVHHMVLPLVCYVIGNFAILTFLMKNSLMSEVNKDYVRTALSKGNSYRQAIIYHAFRNALIPVMTGIGGILTLLFAGSLLIEKCFQYQWHWQVRIRSHCESGLPCCDGDYLTGFVFRVIRTDLIGFCLCFGGSEDQLHQVIFMNIISPQN